MVDKQAPSVPPKERRPDHIAVIMDGNGRWARQRGLPRLDGHRKGADTVREITTFSRELEVPYLTLFSFSVQNWRRPPEEVGGLMRMLKEYCEKERDTLMDNQVRLVTIGSLERLPPATREAVEKLKLETRANHMMTVILAVDYGGREELVSAAQRLAEDVRAGHLEPAAVSEETVRRYLYTGAIPDPDLVIRTSGELRVSNFLLWQIAYSELHFSPVFWPDFTREHFAAALWEFARRRRRFGATQEQVGGKDAASC